MGKEESDAIIMFLQNAVIVATKVAVESGENTDHAVENIVEAGDRHRLTVLAADHAIADDLVHKRNAIRRNFHALREYFCRYWLNTSASDFIYYFLALKFKKA